MKTMNQRYLRGIYLRLTGALMLIVMLALGANAYLSHRGFEHALVPEMAKQVISGGASARNLVLKAMEYNIGFRELYGVEQTFDELKGLIPDIAYIAVTDTTGAILYQRFKADESSQAIAGPYLREHPQDNNERMPIHEHVSVPLPEAPGAASAAGSP